MSFAKNMLNEGRQDKSLWTNAGLFFLIVVGTALLAGLLNNTLHQEADRLRQTELQLLRLLQQSYALNAYEWQAIAHEHISEEIREKVSLNHRDLRLTLESLLELDITEEDVHNLTANYSYYIQAVEDEFSLLDDGQVEAAQTLNQTLVDPAFEQLQQVIQDTNRRFGDRSRWTMRMISIGSVLILLLGITTIGILIWKFTSSRYAADIAIRESEVLKRSNMLLEIEIDARKDLEKELVKTKEQAEAATKTKSDFLAMMSHEIRTPMNGVLGFTSLLQSTPMTAEQQGFVKKIHSSGRTLLALLNDILDLSKIEAGKIDLETHTFLLNSVIQDARDRVATKASKKGLRINSHVESDVPAVIIGDSIRTGQVLGNLLSNAVKFTEQGGVNIHVSCDEIPEDKALPYLLHFSVQDTGIGIPQDRLGTIFDSFTQADSSTTRQYGGSGLGLAICKRLCSVMGGDIYVESREGIGSIFHFTIQAIAAPESLQNQAGPVAQPSIFDEQFAQRYPMRILIAEDNKMNQELAQLFFSHLGYQPLLVANGQLAADAVDAEGYDVIFMDIYMPELDGIAATLEIREKQGRKHRIIAMTASVTTSDRQKCRAAGMDGFLSKPIQIEQLKRLLQRLSLAQSKAGTAKAAAASQEGAGSVQIYRDRVEQDRAPATSDTATSGNTAPAHN